MNKCIKCDLPIETNTSKGRNKSYCSTACRRTAELEIRRINERLTRLERIAEDYRLKLPVFDIYGTEENILSEINVQESKLRSLLAGMNEN